MKKKKVVKKKKATSKEKTTGPYNYIVCVRLSNKQVESWSFEQEKNAKSFLKKVKGLGMECMIGVAEKMPE